MLLSSSKRNGFTLIEIMIVVAVLAILVSTVVIVQKTTVARARNTRILNAVADARKVIEKVYMRESNGYESVCDGDNFNARNNDLDELEEQITENGGSVFCRATQNSYCLNVTLFDGQLFCVDDESHFGEIDENVCEDGGESTCLP